jgi:hypothetical protein
MDLFLNNLLIKKIKNKNLQINFTKQIQKIFNNKLVEIYGYI